MRNASTRKHYVRYSKTESLIAAPLFFPDLGIGNIKEQLDVSGLLGQTRSPVLGGA